MQALRGLCWCWLTSFILTNTTPYSQLEHGSLYSAPYFCSYPTVALQEPQNGVPCFFADILQWSVSEHTWFTTSSDWSLHGWAGLGWVYLHKNTFTAVIVRVGDSETRIAGPGKSLSTPEGSLAIILRFNFSWAIFTSFSFVNIWLSNKEEGFQTTTRVWPLIWWPLQGQGRVSLDAGGDTTGGERGRLIRGLLPHAWSLTASIPAPSFTEHSGFMPQLPNQLT